MTNPNGPPYQASLANAYTSAAPTNTLTNTPTRTPVSTPTATPYPNVIDSNVNTRCESAQPVGFDSAPTRARLYRPDEQDWFQFEVTTVPWRVTAEVAGGGRTFRP